jgi:hypothetical protein
VNTKHKLLEMSEEDWAYTAALNDGLTVCILRIQAEPIFDQDLQSLESATLDFSVKGQPTICHVLPIYKQIEQDLKLEAKKLAHTYQDISIAFDRGSQKASISRRHL